MCLGKVAAELGPHLKSSFFHDLWFGKNGRLALARGLCTIAAKTVEYVEACGLDSLGLRLSCWRFVI